MRSIARARPVAGSMSTWTALKTTAPWPTSKRVGSEFTKRGRTVAGSKPMTLQIGITAGLIGVGFGATLAFIAAYYGGKIDIIIKGLVDTGLTIPAHNEPVLIGVADRILTVERDALVERPRC